jgi:AbrB family looped-hinge helix DNA binding protein
MKTDVKMDKRARVSSKGQVVLPKHLRERLGIREGDYIVFRELPDGYLLLGKQPDDPLDAIVSGLRRAARERHFTREDLERAIHEVRGKRPSV